LTRCGPIVSVLDDVLLHCQNSSTLESAHGLLQTLSSNPKFSHALETTGVLNEILEDMGFGGLWRSCSFNNAQEQDKRCFGLTEKLIEVTSFRIPGTGKTLTGGAAHHYLEPRETVLSSHVCVNP
jgi:neurofibromin 1